MSMTRSAVWLHGSAMAAGESAGENAGESPEEEDDEMGWTAES